MTTQAAQPQAGPYGLLVGPGAKYAGPDQGIDFTGGPFPIYALGPGTVSRSVRSGSGWPGEGALVSYDISGGWFAGRSVYVAEDFVPAVKAGQPVSQGQVIGTATGSGKAPGIEIGYADTGGHALGKLGTSDVGKQFGSDVQAGKPTEALSSGGNVSGGSTSSLDQAVAAQQASGSPLTASLRELLLRLGELALGMLLLYLAFRNAPGALRPNPVGLGRII